MPQPRINIVHIVVNEHGAIFSEMIELLGEGLTEAGAEVRQTTNTLEPGLLNLLVGHTAMLQPADHESIIRSNTPYCVFQAEALDEDDGYLLKQPSYLPFLRSAAGIWDYSPANVTFLHARGCPDVHYIPLGYSKRLERIDVRPKDIDVLFFGALTGRRTRLFDEMVASGVQLHVAFATYGPRRDDLISRAKIVLNVHQFEMSPLEQVRISYLLNNRSFVISESAEHNPYGDGVVFCRYETLPEQCRLYLRPEADAVRLSVADTGYRNLRAIPFAARLRSALNALIRA